MNGADDFLTSYNLVISRLEMFLAKIRDSIYKKNILLNVCFLKNILFLNCS